MLELLPNCELGGRDLPPDSPNARICSYECTFRAGCVDSVLNDVCPNGGGASNRPIRPRESWREATGLAQDPPGAERRRTRYKAGEIDAFVARLRDAPPAER
jgi:uncharacterized protein